LSSIKPDRASIRKFGIVFSGIVLIIALVSLWRGRESLFIPLVAFSILLLLSSFVYPLLLYPLYFFMLKISGYMGWLNTRILLVVMYYIIFTPVALLFKLLGKDPLSRHFDRDATTYWMKREEERKDVQAHFEKQF